jgi:hypothetical protein
MVENFGGSWRYNPSVQTLWKLLPKIQIRIKKPNTYAPHVFTDTTPKDIGFLQLFIQFVFPARWHSWISSPCIALVSDLTTPNTSDEILQISFSTPTVVPPRFESLTNKGNPIDITKHLGKSIAHGVGSL